MPDLGSKVDIFREAVLSESRAEAQKIRDGLELRHREDMKRRGDEVRIKAERYEQTRLSEISSREERRISAHRNHNKHTLLQYREECANVVFEMAKTHVEAYTKSDEYPKHMVKLLKKAMDQFGSVSEAEVSLRAEDMGLTDMLRSAVPDTVLHFKEGKFVVGGMRLVNKSIGLRIDMSFDTAFTDLFGRFSEISGMHID
jgi:Archaeal/vacuolar-type H+-ATPase subunit E